MVKPANFATEGTSGRGGGAASGLLAPVFTSIAKWFARYEAASERGGAPGGGGSGSEPDLPELLPLEVAVPAPEPLVRAERNQGRR